MRTDHYGDTGIAGAVRISPLIAALLFISCGAKTATVHQPCATFSEDESDLSIRNSIVAVSGVPKADPNCAGSQMFVSSGTSLAGGAIAAAEVAGGLSPKMGVAPPQKMKGIFSTDDWAASVVKKMDGSTFTVAVPGLAQDIVIRYSAPLETPAR